MNRPIAYSGEPPAKAPPRFFLLRPWRRLHPSIFIFSRPSLDQCSRLEHTPSVRNFAKETLDFFKA
jgi:hypothetical protein